MGVAKKGGGGKFGLLKPIFAVAENIKKVGRAIKATEVKRLLNELMSMSTFQLLVVVSSLAASDFRGEEVRQCCSQVSGQDDPTR